MNDLDLSSLASGPAPVLAPASAVRARGEQRTRRTRASVAGAAALVVAASAGTAIALSSSGDPDSLQIAGTPTPSATSAVPLGSAVDPISWNSFPRVDRVASVVPGDWVSSAVADYDFPDEYDRCDVTKPLPEQRLRLVERSFTTADGGRFVDMRVEDFATPAQAADTLHRRATAIRRCSTVATDGPGAGSQDTMTITRSDTDQYLAHEVQRECQRDHADCHDSGSDVAVRRAGHLLVTVTSSPGTGDATSQIPAASVERLGDELAATAEQGYGVHEDVPHVDALAPVVGHTYYGAVLATVDVDRAGAARDLAIREGYSSPFLPVRCLEGLHYVQNPAAPDPTAAVLLLPDAGSAEDLVNGWPQPTEGVQKVTVTCLS